MDDQPFFAIIFGTTFVEGDLALAVCHESGLFFQGETFRYAVDQILIGIDTHGFDLSKLTFAWFNVRKFR